jgi:Virulence factor BrkB
MNEPSPPNEPKAIEPVQAADTALPAVVESPVEPGGPMGPTKSVALTAWGRKLMADIQAKRPEHASIEVCFRWIELEKDIAGGVLGGGLAYRFFFWTLSLSLLTAGGLGIASRSNADVASTAADTGLGDEVADTVAAAAQQAESGRWWLLVTGLFLTLWFSWGLLRALWLTHAAAWRMRPPPIKSGPKALAVVVAVPFLLAALSAGAGWVRANVGLEAGAVATVAVSVAFAAGWLWVSMKLPAPAVAWKAFLPGGILLAVGFTALHIFTVYYLGEKLARSSELYGTLGLAATVLFYLFLLGRGVVWAAELNAVVWGVRRLPDVTR